MVEAGPQLPLSARVRAQTAAHYTHSEGLRGASAQEGCKWTNKDIKQDEVVVEMAFDYAGKRDH